MKKLLTLFCVYTKFTIIVGQTTAPALPDTSIVTPPVTLTSFSEALKTYQPRILKPSPEVAGIQQIGHNPVSYYNGKAQVGMPLLSLPSKELSHEVSLSFDTGGIKVEQEATQVGLGVNLAVVPPITRTIRGRDDFNGLLRFTNSDQANLNSMRASTFNILTPTDAEWTFNHIIGAELVTSLNLFCLKNYAPSIVQPTAIQMGPILDPIEAGKPRLDGESDIFSVNAGSYSVKFIIVPTATSYVIKTMDGSPVKIELLPIMVPDLTGNSGFKITTPDGVQYYYTVTEKLISRSGTSYSGRVMYPEIQNNTNPDNAVASIEWDLVNISAAIPTITSWNLTSIVSATDPNDKIEFSYTQDTDYSAIALPSRVNNLTINSLLWRLTDNRQKNVMLSEITSPKGKIVFTRTSRLDLRGNMAQKLDKITLYDQFNTQVKGYNFAFSYFGSGDNTVPDFVNKRLKLESVTEFGKDNTTLPSTVFSYKGTVLSFGNIIPATLPNKNSYAQDLFGFYNNENANDQLVNTAQGVGVATFNKGTLVAAVLPPGAISAGWGFANPAVRSLNFQYAQLGTVETITYPTGGSTVYEYESNQFNNASYLASQPTYNTNTGINANIAGGGLRIKSSTLKTDASTIALKRAYLYGNSGGTASMKLMFDMDFSQLINNGNGSPYQVFSSIPQVSFSNGALGSPIGYSIVRETDFDGSIAGNGYTSYEFDNSIEVRKASFCFPTLAPNGTINIANCGASITTYGTNCTYSTVSNGTGIFFDKIILENASIPNEYDGMNGLLRVKTKFDVNNNPVEKEENNYSEQSTEKIKNLSAVARNVGDMYPSLWTYFNTLEWIALDSKTTTQYFPSGNISVTENYSYNNNNQQIASITMQGSDGDIGKKTFTYPLITGTTIEQGLIAQNRVNEILEEKLENFTQNKEIAKIRNNYIQIGSKILLSTAREIRTGVDDGIDDIQVYYDTESNIKRIISRSMPETHYLYAYNGQYPVSEIKGCTETELTTALSAAGSSYIAIFALNSDATLQSNLANVRTQLGLIRSSIHMSSFTHNPLTGINQAVSPNGLKTSFEYDAFSRLQKTRDHDGNLLKQNTYTIGAGLNKIQTFAARITALSLGISISDYQCSIQHVDNLGRPLQTISLKASPDALTDIITGAVTYDGYGRPGRSYIPYANAGNGSLAALPATVHGDSKPYGYISQYDNSPLNRPLASLGIGEAWHNANKTTNMIYDILPAGNMQKYTITPLITGSGAAGATLSGTYGTPLYMTTTIDEQGNASIEYKDNEGKTIQKAVEESAGNYLRTYYIYDAYDRPAYIIQPENFATPQSFVENDAYFTAGVFAYHYDSRARVYESHVPAGGWKKYVFDKKGRKVLEQDAYQATLNKWNFTKYDMQNRPVFTGQLNNPNSRLTLQSTFNTHLTPDEVWGAGGYNGVSFPSLVNPIGTEVQKYDFYDNYDFVNILAPSQLFNSTTAYHNQYSNVIGLPTGVLKYNSTDSTKYYTDINYFDNKNRIIQAYNTSIKSSANGVQPIRKDYKYNFIGEITKVKTFYSHANITKEKTITLDHVGRKLAYDLNLSNINARIATYNYDPVGRMIHKTLMPNGTYNYGGTLDYINRPPSPQNGTVDIARKAINLLPGTLVPPNYMGIINPNATGGNVIKGLQNIDYTYHIRGGLLGINLDINQNPVPNTAEGDLFSYKLGYETAGFWDGNIGKQSWKRPNEVIRSYDFIYDKSSRLKTATYTGLNTEEYSMPAITYDRNGNIKTLERKGKTSASYGTIDNLTYTYSGNKLINVNDAITSDNSVDFVKRGAGNYKYLQNGNLYSDDNERIVSIIYNSYLNLPKQINLSNGDWIKYTYDGSGSKIRTDYSTGEFWELVDDLIYKNNMLFQIADNEGRLINKIGILEYEFNYKDHLGNARNGFKEQNGNLIQTAISDFDPFYVEFGGNLKNFDINKWEIQNHEKEKTFNLNRIDFGARVYNPTIGNFDKTDRFSSKYLNLGSYTFSAGNPIKFIDVNGDSIQVKSSDSNGNLIILNWMNTASKGYGLYDSNGDIYSGNDKFINTISTALSTLTLSKKGNAYLEQLTTQTEIIAISYAEGRNVTQASLIYVDPALTVKTPLENGNKDSPFYITLIHEMAHAHANSNGVKFEKWIDINTANGNRSLSTSEIYASHIENIFRSKHGQNLRTHYSPSSDGGVVEESRLLNNQKNSLYFLINETKPTGMQKKAISDNTGYKY
jgi:RHS repeat-associated protein